MSIRTSVVKAIPVSVLLLALCGAQEPSVVEPIKELKGIKARLAVLKAGKATEPVAIKSAEEAATHFADDALRTITESIDFDKQLLLLFAWRGSGGDRLSFDVAESDPEQIMFTLKRGRTRDLRPHVHLFVLRSNVQWRVKPKMPFPGRPRKKAETTETDAPKE